MSRVRCGKPDCIGQYLTINLTRDILGVSSTGYVIRTSCSDGPCALKRTQAMDEVPPDLAKLSHENVVELMHYWTEEKDLFLVMELMDGDLGLLMEETNRPGVSPFSLSVAVDFMLQIAKGMLHLHERGVSHPHLKCDNVLYKLRGEAFRVGDVIVKVGGFGCSRPADMESMQQDVLRFGLTCLEILTGDEIPSGGDMRSRVPETTPVVLRDCILRCLETQPGFSEVVMSLLQARSFIMQTCRDEMVYSGEIAQAESTKSMTEELSSTFISNGGLREIFAVHELHSQLGDVTASIPATLIFFHGFHKVAQEWRRTWMTRNNKLVWSQKWLPEDLGAENIRVLSVSCDANSNVSNNYNRFEMGKKLVQALVLSPKWKLGEIEESIILIGHSFGGVLIKSLVTEARHFVQNYVGQQEAVKCGKFLERLAKIVFYSVPHASTGLEFENYISECRKIVALQESSFLQSLEGDADFVADMNKLSVDFERVVPEKVKFLAFLEGKPISMNQVLVTEKSYEGSSRSWEWHKIDKDNHFEVCRPNSKEHAGYRVLLDHLKKHLNPSRGVTSSAADVLSTSLFGKRQDDDGLSNALQAVAGKRPLEKRFRFCEEGSSSNASVTPAVGEIPRADPNPTIAAAASVPTTYYSTPPDTSSDQNREQDDETDREEGWVRFRENLGKYVTEYRPPRFKWKLWMGTYASIDEARRACDCARFYADPDKGGTFYFQDSPALFAELGPLARPLASVSKDFKDKAFNSELKKRAKQVIRKLVDAERNVKSNQRVRPSDPVESSDAFEIVLKKRAKEVIRTLKHAERNVESKQQVKPSDPVESSDPFEIDSQVQSWEGSGSQWSFYESQLDHEQWREN